MLLSFSPIQIAAAVILDLALGDPPWFPHPVRLLGWLAARTENITRRLIRHERTAGILTVTVLLGVAGGACAALLHLASLVHPWAAQAVGTGILYFTIAARDLTTHSRRVHTALLKKNLPEARRQVAMIVGRETAELDEAGVVRAAVESVAESTVDGVAAPLFYAMLAGPLGALLYRTANTMDSMFGYKNERYRNFGWAAARLDDLLNLLPARIGALLIAMAAFLLHRRSGRALEIVRRDARRHASPNAGFPEAAFAGALGVQLGGTNVYFGQPLHKPTIGDADEPLQPDHIRQANRLMLTTVVIIALIVCGIRAAVGDLT